MLGHFALGNDDKHPDACMSPKTTAFVASLTNSKLAHMQRWSGGAGVSFGEVVTANVLIQEYQAY